MAKTHILLKGGLGNQLFQTGFGLYLEQKHGRECSFVCSSYILDSKRRSEVFDVIPNLKKDTLIFDLIYLPFVSRKIVSLPIIRPNILSDYCDPTISKAKIVSGYFQDYKYSEYVIPFLQNWLNQDNIFLTKNIISVHIRRTDFLQSHLLKYEYLKLLDNYYVKAIRHAISVSGIRDVGIVSDDPEGAISDLKFLNIQKLDINIFNASGASARDDFTTLAGSAYTISSNSTFSWWAVRVKGAEFTLPKIWLDREKYNSNYQYSLDIPGSVII